MKTRKRFRQILIVVLFATLVPGCIVISFYPLYEKDDLFANDLLLGQWRDSDSSMWQFNYNYTTKDGVKETDSLSYSMTLVREDGRTEKSSLDVHIIKLDGIYYLDFYLDDYEPTTEDRSDFFLFDLHMMPVHTFARLQHWGDSALIEWFNPDWLNKEFKENKVRLRHEDNGETILLTARPKELQKFVIKYGHIKDAYDTDLRLYK